MKVLVSPWLTTEIMEKTKEYILRIKQGESAEEVAVSIYQSLGKSEAISRMMIGCIKGMIEEYHESLDLPTEEMLKKKLDQEIEATEGIEERCEFYHRLLTLLSAYQMMSLEDEDAEKRAKDFIQENINFAFQEGEDPIEKEAELREAVEKALKESKFSCGKIDSLFDDISLSNEEMTLPSITAKFGRESADLKLILCTYAYVNYIKGGYQENEVSLTLEQIVNAICVGVDLNSIADKLDKGEEILEKLLTLLFCVFTLAMVITLNVLLFEAFVALFTLPWAIATFIAFYGMLCILDEEDGEFLESLKFLGCMVQESIEIVLTGIYDLFNYVSQKFVDGAKAVFDFIIRKFFPGPGPAPAPAGAECIENNWFSSDIYENEDCNEDEDEDEDGVFNY